MLILMPVSYTHLRKIRFGTLYNAAGGILPVSKAVVYVSSLDNKFEKVAEKEFTYDCLLYTSRCV